MPEKKASRRKPRKKESNLDRKVRHFEEEVGKIGERFEKKMEKGGEDWESWFERNFGVVGPFLSSVLSLVCLGVLILVLGFLNQFLGAELLTNVNSFLTVNMGLLFLLFLLFAYLSYMSKNLRNGRWLVTPVQVSAGITVAVWLVIQALMIVNLSSNGVIAEGTSFFSRNLFHMFWFLLALGYLVVLVKVVSCCSVFEERRTAKRKVKYKRLYRSGNDRILGGVCGGIAEYMGVDPVVIRLIWIVGTMASLGIGILAYIIAWIIIPRNPKHKWK